VAFEKHRIRLRMAAGTWRDYHGPAVITSLGQLVGAAEAGPRNAKKRDNQLKGKTLKQEAKKNGPEFLGSVFLGPGWTRPCPPQSGQYWISLNTETGCCSPPHYRAFS
jgi:hypothetical protein